MAKAAAINTLAAARSFIRPIFSFIFGSTKSQSFSMEVLMVSAIKTKKQTPKIIAASVGLNFKYTIRVRFISKAKSSI